MPTPLVRLPALSAAVPAARHATRAGLSGLTESDVLARSSGRRVPRSPGWPVDLDRHALRVDPRLDQVEREIRTGLGEQPRALAENHGNDDQRHLVDQIVLKQPPDQDATAVHL